MAFDAPIRYAFLAYKNARVRRFLNDAPRAREVQREVLLGKLAKCANSDYGKEHGFGVIRSVEDFRKRIPISTYEDFRPYIDRVMQGEVTAMFAPGTRILMYAMTSGTTDKPKHLPVTEDFYRHYRESWNLWGTQVYNDHRQLLSQKTLQLSSDWKQQLAPSGVPCGNISGLAAETRPFYTKSIFFLPAACIRISDPAAKHYTALRIAMAARDVAMIITANPSTLVEFAKRADAQREMLIRDMHDGTLSEEMDVPGHVRDALRWRLRPKKRRARELDEIICRTGKLYPKDFWPQMALLAVWTGGSVGVYLSQLEEFYGRTAIRDHGISASEARMTIPFSDSTPAGILDFRHQFFEFIPEADIDSENPTVLEAHELEEGQNYFILLTTSAGIYRYNIYDVVRCVGYQGQAPLLEFLNKGKHFSSITGEKLSEHQVVAAVQQSFADLNLPSATFTLAPAMDERPYYELLLEPGPHMGRELELANALQQRLTEQNWEYGEKCGSGRILPARVREIPAGTWTAFRRQRSAARGNFEEFKHPCLVSDFDFCAKLPTLSAIHSENVA